MLKPTSLDLGTTCIHANECKAVKIDLPHADMARLINQAESHHHLINGNKMELSMFSISGFQRNPINGVDKLLHCSQFSMAVFTLFGAFPESLVCSVK